MLKIVKRISLTSAIAAAVFMVIQVLADLYLPTLTSNIIDKGVAQGDVDYIWHTGFVMIGFSLISILAAIANTFFATRESQKLGKQLRTDVYKKSESLTKDAFDKYGTASLITRTTNDVTQIQMVTQMFLRMMINAPITLIGASILAYQKDHQLTKIFLVVIPVMIILIGGIMYFAVPLFKSMQKKTDRLNLGTVAQHSVSEFERSITARFNGSGFQDGVSQVVQFHFAFLNLSLRTALKSVAQ